MNKSRLDQTNLVLIPKYIILFVNIDNCILSLYLFKEHDLNIRMYFYSSCKEIYIIICT